MAERLEAVVRDVGAVGDQAGHEVTPVVMQYS